MKVKLPFGKSRESLPAEMARDFVSLCYREILKRDPDPEGLREYVDRLRGASVSPAEVLEEFWASEEFLKISGGYEDRADPDVQRTLDQLNAALTQDLEACRSVTRKHYESLWHDIFGADRSLVIGQDEYGHQHKERFWELCNALVCLTEGHDEPDVIEFGVSEFTGMYRQLLPGMTLDCADRPSEEGYVGFNEQTSLRVSGGRKFVAVDLNLPNVLLGSEYRYLHGQYDLVLFAEVLEHLTANPVQVIRQLLALLKPAGYLYLTTPNFFRAENLEKIATRENPQEVYPADDGNWDAHHHYREYGVKEMFRFIEQAGGKTEAFCLSDCLDLHPVDKSFERGNMVFVVTGP